MSIWTEVHEAYDKAGLSLDKDYAYYQLYGYIFQGPNFFIMGEELDDAWFVQIAIGKGCVPLFLRLMPFEKPYISFSRVLRNKHEPVKIPLNVFRRLYGRKIS